VILTFSTEVLQISEIYHLINNLSIVNFLLMVYVLFLFHYTHIIIVYLYFSI